MTNQPSNGASGSESATSSSHTVAGEQDETGAGGVLGAEVNDISQDNHDRTTSKDELIHQKKGLTGTLSSSSQTTTVHNSSKKSVEHEHHQKSEHSSMQRTINTIPVWARQQCKVSQGTGDSEKVVNRSPKSNTALSESPMKRPAPLHLNETSHTRTALATQDSSKRHDFEQQYRDSFDADRRSIGASSYNSKEEDEQGPSRFVSLSYRTMGPTRRPQIPFFHRNDDDDDRPKRPEMKENDRKRTSGTASNAPPSAGLSSLVSGLVSEMRSTEGQNSKDTNTSESKPNEQSYNYDDEKYMSGMHEGTRGGWSHDDTPFEESGMLKGKFKKGLARRTVQPEPSFSRHQPLTPGWEEPWRPESRGEHSIKFGKFRFNNHGEGGFFPRTETAGSSSSRKKRRNASGPQGSVLMNPSMLLDWGLWRRFLLHNAFVPLLFRTINIGFTSSTFAIAIKLFMILRQEGAEDSVGMSPIIAIVFAPLTLTHVCIQIYLEYFSRPIGLWRVGSKLFYTMTELIFVCLWSAELSLSFDNYFTSTLVCSTFNSPYNRKDNRPVFGEQVLNDPSKKPYICRLQGALIGLVFTSLLAYVVVFSVSLFRIFVRVSKR